MTGRRRSLRLQSREHHSEADPSKIKRSSTPRAYGSFTDDSPLRRCKYRYRGCKRRLLKADLIKHESECSFRWYICEGRKFAGWDCTWKGYYEDILHHFRKVHRERTYMKVRNVIETTMIESDSYDIQLIQRRNRLFWFKHRMLNQDKAAYWQCQYVGPHDEAVTFCYEFVISDKIRKFAVTELCHTDALDANQIYASGKCAVMTFDQMKSFAGEAGKLRIYFRIKKNVKAKR